MKIFDCFTFNNELDILELRLQEHWDHVDHFVISESNVTHNNANKKPFYLYENWDRFKDYHEKITHIQVDDMPGGPNPWDRENFQRNALERGLSSADPDDVIAISDCDELLRPVTWETMRDPKFNVWGSATFTSNFKFNYILTSTFVPHWYYIFNMAVRAKTKFSPQYIRDMRVQCMAAPGKSAADVCIVDTGGWHFSNIGNNDFVKTKINNMCHTEYQFVSEFVNIDKSIALKKGIDPDDGETFEIVKMDNYFPQTILSNLDRWKDYILPDEGCPTVKELINSIRQEDSRKKIQRRLLTG